MMRIYIGSLDQPDFYFDDEQIFSCNSTQSVALVGTEFSIDTFTAVVMDDVANVQDIHHFVSSDGFEIITANTSIYAVDVGAELHVSDLIDVPYGTPVWCYAGNDLIGKFYLDYVTRQGQNKYEINCVSFVGLLEKIVYRGDLFLSSTFQNVLKKILAKDKRNPNLGTIVDYTIEDDVAAIPVSGWIPYGKTRDALYQLIFANGVNVIKNANGDPHFTFIHTAPETPVKLAQGNIFIGGNVEYQNPYSVVSVTEHSYSRTNMDEVTLFDNTEDTPAVGLEVKFSNAPIRELQASQGLSINEHGVNYAIVSGSGVLKGIPYAHSTRVLTSEIRSGANEKAAKVENCTMVNVLNSSNLMNRLKAYFQQNGKARTIKNSVVSNQLKPGQAYDITTPFYEQETAYLTSMSLNLSTVCKADCTWRANYSPAGQVSLYKHVEVISGQRSGTWTVPEDVTSIKAILIGGGTGGSSGWPGKNGKDVEVKYVEPGADFSGLWYGAEGGDGGEGGSGGTPGRIRIVELENLTPGTVFHYTLGEGGEGGTETGFIPDTEEELKAALDIDNPGWEEYAYPGYFDDEMRLELACTDWDGSPHNGNKGTATTFEDYSTDDNESFVSSSGVYDPITMQYYALYGNNGVHGGKGGARKIEKNGVFVWTTDGEDVEFDKVVNDDEVLVSIYLGGKTGASYSDASLGYFTAYGGNGAGAAVGMGRDTGSTQIGSNTYAVGLQRMNGKGAGPSGSTIFKKVYAGKSGRHNDPRYDQTYSYLPSPVTTIKKYGCGGDGGHGGGGGAGSSAVIAKRENEHIDEFHTRSHGYGSGGGRGGKGGDGCILIYY